MWKKYKKTTLQEMRPYIVGEDLTGISVAPNEEPQIGGMIARDAQGSQWYVSPEFMLQNYVIVDDHPHQSNADIFVAHIQNHLSPGQDVICKICGKTVNEIANQVDPADLGIRGG